jgi:hypothetical protein
MLEELQRLPNHLVAVVAAVVLGASVAMVIHHPEPGVAEVRGQMTVLVRFVAVAAVAAGLIMFRPAVLVAAVAAEKVQYPAAPVVADMAVAVAVHPTLTLDQVEVELLSSATQ